MRLLKDHTFARHAEQVTVALLVLLPAAAGYCAECFDVGPDDGRLAFDVDQAGSTFDGSFDRFGGRVCMQGDTVARVNGWVEPGSVSAGLPEIQQALRGTEFFDVDEHPRGTFDSTDVEKTADGYVAHGTLTVKGVSRPVNVPFTVSDGSEGRRVDGSLALHRLDFQIGTGEWADTRWLGNDVTVKFSGRLR